MKKIGALILILFAAPVAAETLEGRYQPVVVDFADGQHREDSYVVQENGTQTKLLIPEGSSARSLLPGTRVRFQGQTVGDSFEVFDFVIIDDTEAKAAVRAAVTGTRRVAVIMVNFQNDTRTPYTQSQAQSLMFTSVRNWYRDVSYNQVDIAGDVYGWITLPINASCAPLTVWQAVQQAAPGAGITLANYDHHYLVIPRQGCGWAGIAYLGSNLAMTDQYLDLRVTTHELGHNLGLQHANRLDCGSSILASPVDASCTNTEYGDLYDAMGSNSPRHFNAAYKEKLGWLPPAELPTALQNGIYDLGPIESAGSTLKGLKVPSIIDGKNINLYFEYRRPLNQDVGINDSRVINGALMHIFTPYGLAGLYGRSVLLDGSPGTDSFSDAGLAVGETFEDPLGTRISVVSADGSTLRLQVQFEDETAGGIVEFGGPLGAVVEGDSDMTLAVHRKIRAEGAITVPITLTNGTAVAGLDFDGSPRSVSFADGELGVKNITIPIINDTDVESMENFYVNLGAPVGGGTRGSVSQVTVSIIDVDTPPVDSGFSFSAPTVNIQENGGQISLTIRYTGNIPVGNSVSVQYATVDGSANGTSDYVPASGTVQFSGATRQQVITVNLRDDAVAEPLEQFTVQLSNPVGSTLGNTPVATVRITDDDSGANRAPAATASSVSLNEDSSVAVTLSGTDPDGDSLTYRVTDGPLHGNVSGTPPNLTYTAAPNFHGTDTFSFVANDGTLDSVKAAVTLSVLPVNDRPMAQNQAVTAAQAVPRALTLSATDVDGDALTYRLIAGPAHGTISGAIPNLSYLADAHYIGPDQLVFEVSDGNATDTGSVSLTVVSNLTPPSVSILEPVEGQVVNQGVNLIRIDATGVQAIARVLIYLDDQPVGDKSQAPYELQLDLKTAGEHELRVVALDAGGNSASKTVKFSVRPPAGQSEIKRNVFNPARGEQAEMTFSSDSAADVQIFDRLGNLVHRAAYAPAGGQVTVTWDGRNDQGARVASGLYRMRITIGSAVHKRSLVVVK